MSRFMKVGMWGSNIYAEPTWYLSALEITKVRQAFVTALGVSQEAIITMGSPATYYTPLTGQGTSDAIAALIGELETLPLSAEVYRSMR